MTHPGRNDPCPCGSGKKYKHCHLAADRDASATLAGGPAHGPVISGMGVAPLGGKPMDAWEVGLIPMPVTIDSTPDARTVVVLVVDSFSNFIVHSDVLIHPPNDPAAIAEVLAESVRAGARSAGKWPRAIWVQHAVVAAALGAELTDRGTLVMAADVLPSLDEAIRSLLEIGGMASGVPAASDVETWAGWGQPRAQVARLFRAAAAFYRAEAWQWIDNPQVLEVVTTRGGSWAVTVMGCGGQEFGLGMYTVADDLRRLCEHEPADALDHFGNLEGGVISLTFSDKRELPRRMQQEVAAARWEVVDRHAYPTMFTVNTPGGGVTTDQFDDVIDLLGAIPRFIVAHRDVLATDDVADEVTWRDADTGTSIVYSGTWEIDQDDDSWW